MKQKILLVFVLAFSLFTTTHAQIKKGGIWLGGSIGYSKQKSDNEGSSDNEYRTIGISPAIGKVIKDNLVVGIALNYNNIKEETYAASSLIKRNGKNYGGGVFVRQYVPIIDRLYIFGQGNATFTVSRLNETQPDYGYSTSYKNKGWNSSVSITPGVAVGINKNLLLETGFNNLFYVSYSKNNRSLDSPSAPKTKQNSFSVGASLENQSAFYLGFRLLINNKG